MGFAYVADHDWTTQTTSFLSNYDEVTVTRRVYRSGESEYRINGCCLSLKRYQ